MNGAHFQRDAHDEIIIELGEILAAGVIRLLAPKSSEQSADRGECSLDFTADQSGRDLATKRENGRA